MTRLFASIVTVLATACVALASTAIGGESGLTYIVPSAAGSDDGARARPTMPDMIFADGSGMPTHLRQFVGQVVVINFWSSACAPCLRELALLDRLQGNNRGQPLAVLAISEDQTTISTVKAFLNRQKYSYLRAFADPTSSMAQALAVDDLPTSIVLDRYNRQILRIQGAYQWEDPLTIARLRKLMSEP
jgi:thiol-disulfide isomerase/thioredoxin